VQKTAKLGFDGMQLPRSFCSKFAEYSPFEDNEIPIFKNSEHPQMLKQDF
jgi:hypothetical protein